jgi:hypothetical protein
MLFIGFSGYWQLRMALDPDPNDEPLGISGPTRVLPGEPNFDALLRFQNQVFPRFPHDKDMGIFVDKVERSNAETPDKRHVIDDHPLLGAAVDLVDGPKFEERGFVTVYQKMPIEPFHLRISGNDIELAVDDLWDPTNPDLTYDQVCAFQPALLSRRSLVVQPGSMIVAEATGITDYAEYRRERRRELEARRADPAHRDEIPALTVRINDLAKDDLATATEGLVGLTVSAQQFLGLCGFYSFLIQGNPVVKDPNHRLPGRIGVSQQWSINFWMGGFDVDALTAFVKGTLVVPFAQNKGRD